MQAWLSFQIVDENFHHLEYIPTAQPPPHRKKKYMSTRKDMIIFNKEGATIL